MNVECRPPPLTIRQDKCNRQLCMYVVWRFEIRVLKPKTINKRNPADM